MSRALYTTSAAPDPNDLIAGAFPTVKRKVILAQGENLARGAVLGRVTADGTYKLSLAAAADGSEAPRAILGETIDATAQPAEAIVFETGHFVGARLTFGAGHSIASTRDGLRGLGIHLA